METSQIIETINQRIEQLTQARNILAGETTPPPTKRKYVKRVISKEGRQAIAAAQKKRWAKTKKKSVKATAPGWGPKWGEVAA